MSRNTAISLSATRARELVQAGAQRALEAHQRQPIKPVKWPGPYVLEQRFFHTDDADGAARAPGFERVDGQTVRRRGDDIIALIYGESSR